MFREYRRSRDPATRDALVERFLPLARQLARRYQRGDEPFDDLVQVASLGLVKAVDRFDLDRAVAFSSYAVPTILGELKRYFRDTTWAVHVPRDLQERAALVDRSADRMFSQTGRAPSVAQIAETTGLSIEEVLEARDASMSYKATSLEAPSGSDGEEDYTLADRLGSSDVELSRAEHAVTLQQLEHVLSDRDREVLRLRFQEDLTQSEIAARIGVSQMHVSRIIRAALERLQATARD
ncbi:MAG: SigB/SigF/SigG family RNA polymerase sigma factor [Solirubrobacteraceae bacterium]